MRARWTEWNPGRMAMGAALLALMGFTSCMGSSQQAGPQPAAPSVRIGGFAAGAGSMAIVMQKMGVFKSERIDAQFIIFPDSTVATRALIDGQIDYLVASNDRPVINAEAGGPPFKVVMGLAERPPWTWIVHPGTSINPGDPPSKLKGLTIGDGGLNTTQRYAERYLLAQAGLDPDRDVQFKVMPQDPTIATAAFERGDVDLLSAIEPTTSTLISRKTGRVYLDLRTPGSPAEFASKESLVSRADYIAKNPAMVRRVVSATCRSVKEAKSDPHRVAQLLVDYYQTQGFTFDRDQREQMLQGIVADSARWGGEIAHDPWVKWETLLEAQGLVKHRYEFQDVVATDFAPYWSC
jgi:ABC-type nitrate/sulfonate/bicarbonate transport system substrate-binding protein